MGPYLGGPEGTPGLAKPNFGVFSRFGGKFGWENCPTVRGSIVRGPQNWFTGVPASKKVLQCLLMHTKTLHKHYGTLPGGPWSAMGPSKSNFVNFALFQLNLPYKTAQTPAGPSCGDPKTGLQGTQHAKK